jgi:S1-C subfamily serine protease
VIVRMDDAAVDTVEDLFGELRQRKPESQVRITFIRDGREQQATVTLADRSTS